MASTKHLGSFTPALLLSLLGSCSDSVPSVSVAPPPTRQANREFRAIAGVSMGAYGAMNLGTKHADVFGTIASLGGPVDMVHLLRQLREDNLEVAAQQQIPRQPGSDFTFDHLPPYPDRDNRMQMARDLFLALGNPFLHHPNPDRRYLAIDSQPALLGMDDEYGALVPVSAPMGFRDGGDLNEDGLRQTGESPDQPIGVLLVAAGTASAIAGGTGGTPTTIGGRGLLDLTGDGVYDVGDGIVLNAEEPFTDGNGNGRYDEGEPFDDFGLDGVDGTGDLGEGNGAFDRDPDRQRWIEEDPVTRLRGMSAQVLSDLRIYMDVGTTDAFEFEEHYDNLVAVLRDKGLTVGEQTGFSGSCASVPDPTDRYLLLRYAGGHVGIPDADDVTTALTQGDFCGSILVWQRLLAMLGFLDEAFPDGDYGTGGVRAFGDTVSVDIASPALTPPGGATVMRRVVVYQPPAFFNTTGNFPIVYFLGGYGQDPEDFERFGNLMDLLIVTDQVQNAYFAFVPGSGGHKGSFYLDHEIPHDQAPGLPPGTGRYETSFLQDLLPKIEDDILSGRIKR